VRISILLLASALFFCSARNAEACDCISVPSSAPIKVNPAWKGMLGVGRIEAVRTFESNGIQTGVLAVDVIVSEAFQNATPGRVTIYTHPFGASCYGYDFRIGLEYLISAIPSESLDPDREVIPNVLPAGSQIVSLCGGTAELRTPAAQQTLDRLRAAFGKK
jgi:hypothetical protein